MPGVDKSKVILIAGPTASGKSALAVRLAERFGGAVINADSMQVYADLRIITARPSDDDLSRAPHRLYGSVSAREAYSAGRFVADAAAAIGEAQTEGHIPILVGGTGLYFSALLDGLSPIPPADDVVRDFWRREVERVGAERLHMILQVRDPTMAARLAPGDGQRIVRALEVLETTGQSIAEWQNARSPPVVAASDAVKLALNPDRADLHARAEARFDAMLAAGAREEAGALAALDLPPSLPAMRAIGLRPLIAADRGEISIEDAAVAAKAETRQYIKRQQTWIRQRMIAWNFLGTKDMESSTASAIAFIDCYR